MILTVSISICTNELQSSEWDKENSALYQHEFLNYYAVNYQEQEDVQYYSQQTILFSTVKKSLKSALLVLQDISYQETTVSLNTHESETLQYMREVKIKSDNVLLLWRQLAEIKPALEQMIKNILTISVADVDVEWLFFIMWDVVIYCWSCFNSDTIINIIMIKKGNTTHVYNIAAQENSQRELN